MSNSKAARSVQEKMTITLLVVVAVLGVLSFVTLQNVVAPAFDKLELDEARTNLIRAQRAIRNDLDNLSAIAGDWGLWDDAYDYVRGEYEYFEESNLDRPTLTNLDLNLLAVYAADGSLVWGRVENADSELGIDSLQVLDPGTETADYLITHTELDAHTDGLLSTALGPMLISSWPVIRSDGQGPIAGTMIMGQLLDDKRMASLQERTEVQLHWQTIDSDTFAEPYFAVPLNMRGNSSMRYETTTDTIHSSGLLVDLFNKPLMILQVSTPRNISALGKSTVNGALLFLAVAGVIVAVVAGLLLRQIIVLPLEGLASHITGIRKSGDLSQRLNESRNDEIGSLARQFDNLTMEVHDARMQLLDQSFKAGKADAAAEVMHNIRNAMTPLVNGLDRLAKNFTATTTLRVGQATDELGDPECDASRREKLLMYIKSAFAHIQATNEDAVENLAIATKQAHQVEAILADQAKHARVKPILEDFDLGNLIEEAALVLPKSDDTEVDLLMQPELSNFRVRGHRVGVLQVLGNVMLNAFESIERMDEHSGKISVSASNEIVADKKLVRLTIKDSGCGFDDNVSKEIFRRGFSSKDGHLSGLGLHWCANALATMDGGIQAESSGPGLGAEFHVLLPAA
jgi:sensor domain CHASE-containing protein